MRIYVGYDAREQRSYRVAEESARRFGHEVIPLHADRLRAAGLFWRPTDTRGYLWDLYSGAPQSTEFALTRFSVPILAHSGLCLYADCDVVFMRDPMEMFKGQHDWLWQRGGAVAVVKHGELDLPSTKMDGQAQKLYPRKLWSSVMLFDCDHPANRRLNLSALNNWHRDDLHGFKWLHDSELSELPPEANWLVGVQPKPERPIIAHYTLGTPELVGDGEYSDLWLEMESQR